MEMRRAALFRLDANGHAGDGIGFGQAAEEAHGASVKRVTAESLKSALVLNVDHEQRVSVGWGVVDAGARLDDAGNACQEFFDIFQRAVNHFAVGIAAQAQDEFVADHLVFPPPVKRHFTIHTVTWLGAFAQARP